MRYYIVFVLFFFIACKHPSANYNLKNNIDSADLNGEGAHSDTVIESTVGDNDTTTNHEYQTTPFLLVKEYPIIKDTSVFIKTIKTNCHLYYHYSKNETINYFKKIKLYNSDKDYYLIEFDYHDGDGAEFPWKYQFVFDRSGRLLKIFVDLRIDVVKIFPDQHPFLFGVFSTEKGNGGHEVLRIRNDSVEQVYDGFLGIRPNTYSTGYFNFVNQPHELSHEFMDVNKDVYNDIVFYGKVRFSKYDLGFQDKIIPVKYIFIYNPQKGHFVEMEDYLKKYEFIYGDTK